MGQEITEELDYIPASFVVRQHVRLKYGKRRAKYMWGIGRRDYHRLGMGSSGVWEWRRLGVDGFPVVWDEFGQPAGRMGVDPLQHVT